MKTDLQTPIRRLKDLLPDILDPKVGMISSIKEHPIEPDSPSFFRYTGMAANTEAFCEFKNFFVGGGAAISREIALAKTVGECIERYCAAIYDKTEFPLYPYREAPFNCVHPADFTLFGQSQYTHEMFVYKEFDIDSNVRWCPAIELGTNNEIYVPAGMVFVPYYYIEDGDETPIVQPISTGLSCHCTYEEAVIGGICEVMERDDFMITWQAKLSRPKLRNETLSEANKDLVNRFETLGYKIHLMDISNETMIPGIMAVAVRNDTAYVPLVVAASVSLDPEIAVRKALEELAHTERYAFQIKGELKRLVVENDFDNIQGQVHHVNFWVDDTVAHHAEFLYSSTVFKDFDELPNYSQDSPKKDMDKLTELINESGYKVIVADITSVDVEYLGMKVIRAIIPGYHPLFMGYHHRPLGGKRLWSIPQKLGYEGVQPATGDNPFPHPFP